VKMGLLIENPRTASAIALRCFNSVFKIAVIIESNRRSNTLPIVNRAAGKPTLGQQGKSGSLWKEIRPHLSELAMWSAAAELIPQAILQDFARAAGPVVTVCGITGESAHQAVFLLGQAALIPFLGAVEELRVIPSFTDGGTLHKAAMIFGRSAIAEFFRTNGIECPVGGEAPGISDAVVEGVEEILSADIQLIAEHLAFVSPLADERGGEFLFILAKLNQEFSDATKHQAGTKGTEATEEWPMRGGEDSVQPKTAAGASMVLTPLQQKIMAALDGKSLKKQPLANVVCEGEGSRLYRPGGINELKAAGLVAHAKGVGYFRRDAAPPGLIVRTAN